MGDAVYSPGARAAHARVSADPSQAALAQRLDAALDQLEHDPGHRSVRAHRFQTVGAWGLEVHHDAHEWWVLWNWWDEVGGDDHIPHVFYIGPAPGG